MSQTQFTHADSQALFLEAKKLRLKRRFGQNFLVDPKVPAAIVKGMDLSEQDTVVEIGPGAGALTEHLLSQAGHVFSVELERDMISHLGRKFAPGKHPFADKFFLIPCDILKFDPTPFLEKGDLKAPFPIVGNIPYNITTPILFYLCGEVQQKEHPWRQWVKHITLMIQQEVAERIVAKPGGKAYNHLSIAIQVWFEARIILTVPRQSFSPAPKVTSSVIQLIPRKEPLVDIKNGEHFSKLIRGAFGQRRKTLKNALLGAQFLSAPLLETMVSNANATLEAKSPDVAPVLLTDRAERISIEAFAALSNAYTDLTSQGSNAQDPVQ